MGRLEVPGIVEICFIMQGGQIPEESMTGDLEKYLRDEKIRPLTDQVIVRAPDVQKYRIDITYYVNRSDHIQTAAIQKKVLSAIQEYIAWQKEKIGRDINPDQLRKMLLMAGAKRAEVRSPVFQSIPQDSLAVLEGDAITLYGGLEDD